MKKDCSQQENQKTVNSEKETFENKTITNRKNRQRMSSEKGTPQKDNSENKKTGIINPAEGTF